jgi:tol-pal system protein YbgF
MMKLYSLVTAAKMAAVVVLSASSLIYSSLAVSQATVRDSSPVTSNPSTRADASTNAVSSGAVASGIISTSTNSASRVAPPQSVNTPPPVNSPNAAYQIQQLQQEISELRGLLEEQGFQLKRLKQQRLDDYLDLDKRLSEITNSNSVINTQAPSNQTANNKNSIIKQSSTASANTISGLSGSLPVSSVDNSVEGKKLYRKAIDQLLSKQDYKGAQKSFSQYLDKYPRGVYVPNVYYWQGQIYLTESKKIEAEKAFTNLISQYRDHQKTPDAKYKLATIYFDQGKKAEAKKLLNEVVASNTDASRLAKSFLANQY